MIESLTPEIVSASLALVVAIAPPLTLIVSLLLLWQYRRVVQQTMADAGGAVVRPTDDALTPSEPGRSSCNVAPVAPRHAFRHLQAQAWRCAVRYVLAGVAFAVVFACAAEVVYRHGLGVPGFCTAVWTYLWPAVLAVLLIVGVSPGATVAFVAGYAVILALLGWWASNVLNVPAYEVGGLALPARSNITPLTLGRMWLVVNGAPTLLVLAFLGRPVRAVAPLVLALVVVAGCGTWAALLGMFSPAGLDVTVAAMEALGISAVAVVAGIIVLGLVSFGALGWLAARWVASAYARKAISDQSLALDALWLVFAGAYAVWLVLGGLTWLAAAPLAFAAYRLTLSATGRWAANPAERARGLTFLRVFALGRRTDALFDQVGRRWRYGGSVQIITGPDLAGSTVQPHQFLDFLGGRLRSHFVRDAATLERSVGIEDRVKDPDGRYRVNNYFCHSDTWRAVLPRITRNGDVVLMDLRLFAPDRAGCLYEIRHLVTRVPLADCVFVIDRSTDMPFLRRVLAEALSGVPQESPNAGRGPDDVRLHGLDRGRSGLPELMKQLCAAG